MPGPLAGELQTSSLTRRCRGLCYVIAGTAAESRSKNTPVTHSTVAGVRCRSIAAASDLLAVRRFVAAIRRDRPWPPPHVMYAHVRASHGGACHASVCTLRPAKIPTTAAVKPERRTSGGICHPPSRSWSQPAAIGPTAASR
jgi:hypothetical protein